LIQFIEESNAPQSSIDEIKEFDVTAEAHDVLLRVEELAMCLAYIDHSALVVLLFNLSETIFRWRKIDWTKAYKKQKALEADAKVDPELLSEATKRLYDMERLFVPASTTFCKLREMSKTKLDLPPVT